MLPELLVVLACSNSVGCAETSSVYFNRYPEMREIVTNNEKKIEKMVGPVIIQVMGPVIYAASGGTGTLRLNKTLSVQINHSVSVLSYRMEF